MRVYAKLSGMRVHAKLSGLPVFAEKVPHAQIDSAMERLLRVLSIETRNVRNGAGSAFLWRKCFLREAVGPASARGAVWPASVLKAGEACVI